MAGLPGLHIGHLPSPPFWEGGGGGGASAFRPVAQERVVVAPAFHRVQYERAEVARRVHHPELPEQEALPAFLLPVAEAVPGQQLVEEAAELVLYRQQ